MAEEARVRRLVEIHTSEWAGFGRALDEGGSMSNGMDAHEDAISERVERNERWGRDASRDTALAELVNEGEIPMWEERPPVQPCSRQGGAVEVRDDF